MKSYAVRNLRLCTKDCLCLYVCPTGATDTENSVIEVAKCIGCGVCAAACPSGAITMMPCELPPQQKKDAGMAAEAFEMLRAKAAEEKIAAQIAAGAPSEGERKLAEGLRRSLRLVAEDLVREAGYMLPQSSNARSLLEALAADPPEGFPVETARRILEIVPAND